MKLDIGLMTFDLPTVAAYARQAEGLGFGAIWSAETRHDPFLPLAVASTTTSRMGLGTAIAIAFARSPMTLAHVAWDLQKASGGRFVLGLGSQVKAHNERRFSVAWEPPGPRLREVYASTRTYQSVLAAHGLEELAPRLHAKSLAGDWEGMADLITDEMLDLFAVSGRFEEIGAKIRERYRGLYDRTQLYPSFQPSLEDPRWRTVLSAFEGA